MALSNSNRDSWSRETRETAWSKIQRVLNETYSWYESRFGPTVTKRLHSAYEAEVESQAPPESPFNPEEFATFRDNPGNRRKAIAEAWEELKGTIPSPRIRLSFVPVGWPDTKVELVWIQHPDSSLLDPQARFCGGYGSTEYGWTLSVRVVSKHVDTTTTYPNSRLVLVNEPEAEPERSVRSVWTGIRSSICKNPYPVDVEHLFESDFCHFPITVEFPGYSSRGCTVSMHPEYVLDSSWRRQNPWIYECFSAETTGVGVDAVRN